MTSILLKKKLTEMLAGIRMDIKKGTPKKKGKVVGMAFLYIFIILSFGISFVGIAELMADGILREPMDMLGLDWLYFGLLQLIGLGIGVLLSIFTAYSSLYNAKDNDLLLSMPVTNTAILISRLSYVYLLGLLCDLVVNIPAIIVYMTVKGFSCKTLILGLIITIFGSLFGLGLSSILGWLVAEVSRLLNNSNFIKVLIALVGMGLYYWFYFNVQGHIASLVASAVEASGKIAGSFNPLYLMGSAVMGNAKSVIYVAGFTVILIGIVYFVLNKSFLRICTTNRGASRPHAKALSERSMEGSSLQTTLFRREMKRFTSSASYMLNCGLGLIFVVAAAVLIVIKKSAVQVFAQMITENVPELAPFVPAVLALSLGMLVSMNDMTAASINIEGQNIWILQSLPVDPYQIFRAKIKLQCVLTGIPLLAALAAVEFAFEFPMKDLLIMAVFDMALMAFTAALGIFLNLKINNLNWTTEAEAVKQGANVYLGLFAGWILIAALCLIYYFLLMNHLDAMNYLLIWAVLLLAGARFFDSWLRRKGRGIFATI